MTAMGGNRMKKEDVAPRSGFVTPIRATYRHGDVRGATLRAAREILDERGADDIGMREVARRVGISQTAAYRHFVDKDEFRATLAAQGFQELAASLQGASANRDPVSIGLAYIDFAHTHQGLFRLMFGPLLGFKDKYPPLRHAVEEAFGLIEKCDLEPMGEDDAPTGMTCMSIHGVALFLINNMMGQKEAKALARRILETLAIGLDSRAEKAGLQASGLATRS
jgi:AcrR family transcriptional regulator